MVEIELNRFFEVKIQPEQLRVNSKVIGNLLGYGEADIEEHISEIINSAIQSSLSYLDPTGGFIFFPINELAIKSGLLKVSEKEFAVKRIIASQLKDSDFVAIFICSIGKRLEELSKSYFTSGDMLEGYIFDLIGSEAAELLTEFVHRNITEYASKLGYNTTNRFSPGYCGWDVGEQFKLFSLFNQYFNYVTLTDSALMNPVKSVSGIVGVGEKVTYKEYMCKLCTQENCIYRNKTIGIN